MDNKKYQMPKNKSKKEMHILYRDNHKTLLKDVS